MIKKPRPTRNINTRRLQSYNYPTQPGLAATVTLVAGKMRLTFTTPVIINGTPTTITANALPCNGVTIISPTVVDLGFSANPVATNPWVIPANVTQIRSQTGGVPSASNGVF